MKVHLLINSFNIFLFLHGVPKPIVNFVIVPLHPNDVGLALLNGLLNSNLGGTKQFQVFLQELFDLFGEKPMLKIASDFTETSVIFYLIHFKLCVPVL